MTKRLFFYLVLLEAAFVLVAVLVDVGVVDEMSRAGGAPTRMQEAARQREMIDRSYAINWTTKIKWPDKTIKLNLEDVPEVFKRHIYATMNYLNSVSCVRYTAAAGSWDVPHITFVSRPTCSSYVGYLGQSSQDMYLSGKCFKRKETFAHEMLHAAGFHHEHQRPDRDDYIFLNLTNIAPVRMKNFAKIEGYYGYLITMGLPYDYNSILHYPTYSFAKDASFPTITVKGRHNHAIGQREELSRADIARLNRLYDCVDHYLGDDIPGAISYQEWRDTAYTQPVPIADTL
ncbi:zinc metalloproteinase nas-14-like [Panulirus ornatus]|uniref:zinc metalloproteinase nas-14-like n=1 Tax=Panulirus ornatus TaxID=150431 RepID=UPI003A86D275